MRDGVLPRRTRISDALRAWDGRDAVRDVRARGANARLWIGRADRADATQRFAETPATATASLANSRICI